MLRTTTSIGKVQAMEARGNPYDTARHTRIKGLHIECQEAYSVWQHQQRIGLCLAWLLRERGTAKEPEYSSDES
jgi:hypothetical protein